MSILFLKPENNISITLDTKNSTNYTKQSYASLPYLTNTHTHTHTHSFTHSFIHHKLWYQGSDEDDDYDKIFVFVSGYKFGWAVCSTWWVKEIERLRERERERERKRESLEKCRSTGKDGKSSFSFSSFSFNAKSYHSFEKSWEKYLIMSTQLYPSSPFSPPLILCTYACVSLSFCLSLFISLSLSFSLFLSLPSFNFFFF